ncbi:MAG: hypothetical protein IIA72_11830 [Proteobacteria bacterium]|nr:hypothetical protein [Pseudomonadota bacterium]
MADAAYKTVEWVEKQFFATVGEIVALVITILVAAVAVAAAFRANRISKDSAQRQLRAYVSQDEPDWKRLLNPETDKHVGYTLMIMWRNFGATPASRCRTRVAYHIFPNGFTSDFDYPEGDTDKQPKPHTSHMGPNGQLGSHIEFKLDDIKKAARGEIDLVVWGWVEYDDVFPGSPRRRTEFSYKVDPRGKPENFQFGLLAIGPHNGADEDCHHKPKT